ncbi:MAG: hypothetical protein C4581_08860 [Nitrospiraceae bacterium]|nr:MAG: hypothetical protein C4581_08860 [Nitrospiraceae bacterium]
MRRLLNFFRKASKGSHLKDNLKERYYVFQNLLNENNQILSLIADMEGKLSGEGTFDRQYISSNAMLVSGKVSAIIRYLNVLSKDQYKALDAIYEGIHKEIEDLLSRKFEVPQSTFTIPVSKLDSSMSNIAGAKMANLGEMKSRLNLVVPEGFVITAYAFEKFFGHNSLRGKIAEALSVLNVEDLASLNEISLNIQQMIVDAVLPPDLERDISEAYDALCREVGGNAAVSVRSSAVREDGECSFAGQYATFLNVRGDAVITAYKDVVASLFTPRAIFYYKTQGFSEEELVMAVGVLRMIDAMSGGVVYTNDPNDPGRNAIVINAMLGLGAAVVDGSADPDTFIINKATGDFLEKKITNKSTMLVCADDNDTKEIAVPHRLGREQSISDEQIIELYNCSLALEKHYSGPQDIEWAVDSRNRLYILQTRPLRMLDSHSSERKGPPKVDSCKVLLDKGVIACKGAGHGRAFVLRHERELTDFPEGAVLIARHTNPRFVKVMNKASAIVTDIGGVTGHMASLSREYNVPTILNTGNATEEIGSGREITVDAFNCRVYEGRVDEILEYARSHKAPVQRTHLHSVFERVLKLISPLNLVDPDKEYFRPENCRTFHDITRFAHETSMAEMFQTGKGFEIDGIEDFMSSIAFAEAGETKDIELQSIILKAGIPVDVRLIDVEGGVKGRPKKAGPEHITSIPFSAFLKGLTNMRWPGVTPSGAQGIGSAAQTSSLTKEQLRKTQEKSYAIISKHHMNFSIRLGFHFSMVEAYAGENINDNYIKFFFKGGGAVEDRKLRRVRLIREILEAMHFKVNVIDDCVDAMLTKYELHDIEGLLEKMGKFTVYTKQLDMALFNDAVADMFIEDFIRDHIKTVNSK